MNKHSKQDFIKRLCDIRLPVYVHGPTGCGKTYLFKNIAEELGLPFYKKLIGAQMTEASLLGYGDAGGNYKEGIVYRPYTEGGLLVLDEIDNGNPNTNLVVNGICDEELAFPIVGMKSRHKNFIAVATANTIGNGATLAYVGRNKLDQAMLNRFIPVAIDYDYNLEKSLALYYFTKTLGKEPTKEQIEILDKSVEDFWLVRKTVNELEIPNHILSQRNLIQQSCMIAAGFKGLELKEHIAYRNLSKENQDKITKKITKTEIEKFKKEIESKSAKELMSADSFEILRNEIEKEKEKLIKTRLDSYIQQIKNEELTLANLEKTVSIFKAKSDLVNVQKQANEKIKELNSLKKEIEKSKVQKPITSDVPNWDEQIMGVKNKPKSEGNDI